MPLKTAVKFSMQLTIYEVSGAFTINNISVTMNELGCFEFKQKQKQNKRLDEYN